MNGGGINTFGKSVNAWIFEADCDGGANTFTIRVHPDFTTQQDATTVALKYGKDMGRLPKVLRPGIGTGQRSVMIHKGDFRWFASDFGGIRIYTEYRSEGYHEEVLFHEAAHMSLDRRVESDSKWLAAQKADGAFISSYAKDNSTSEDVAESFLAYFSARYVPTRIDSDWKDQILQTIPNRIAYFDALLSADDMKPFTAAPVKKVALPSVSVAAKTTSATEGADAVFTVTASPAPTASLTVSLAVTDDTASDFLAASDEGKKTVTITGGQASAELTVPTQDDSADEADGSVTATIQAGDGYTPSGTNASASVPVSDNDAAPSACVPASLLEKIEGYYDHNKARPPGYGVNWFRALVALGARSPDGWTADSRTIQPMTAADARAREANWFGWGPVAEALECLEGVTPAEPAISIAAGNAVTEGAAAVFTVTASPAPTADLVVTLTVADDTNSDFLAQSDEGTQTVTIAGGQASADLTLSTVQDSTDEADGSVTATVQASSGYTIGSPSTATVTVADDDVLPAVGIAGGNAITEGAGAVFTLTATPAPQGDITVKVNITDSGAFASSGAAGARQVTIGTSGTATLDVTTDDDGADEPDGSITATIEAGSGYTIGTSGSASVAVSDDDEPTLSVTISPASASEGDTGQTYATVTFGLDPVRGVATSFKACLKNTGTAARGASADYQLVGAGSDTPLTLAGDCHSYTLAANAASGTVRLLVRGDADVEPDETVVVELQDPPAGVTVSGIAGSATYIILNDDTAPASSCVSATLLEKIEGYYDHNKDTPPGYGVNWFRALVALGARSPDGWTADSRTIQPMTAADARAREANWFGWGPVAEALECLEGVTPAEPEITIAGGNAVTEGAAAVFTLTATPAPQGDITVKVNITDSGAFASSGAAGARQVTIGTSGTATLDVTTDDDGADEPDGSITATIEAGSGYTIGTSGSASVAVSDDDEPTLSVTISPASASEGDTGQTYATVTFGLDPVRGVATSFKACLKNTGTAARGASADYQLVGAGSDTPLTLAGDCHSYTLAANAASGTVRLLVRGDADVEPDETVVVELQDPPAGVTVSGIAGSATYIILNDDTAPTVCVSEQLLADAQLAAGESRPNSPDHVERWSRVLAAFGEENTYSNNPMTIAEAQAQADRGLQRWAPVADALECLEGAVPAEPEITIAGGAGITEGAGAVFTVTASPAPTASLTVSLTVADDTNSDFLAQSDEGTQTVTIAGGEAAATLTLTTVDDSTDEADGSMTATVTAAAGYTVGSPSTTTVAVADNDPTQQGTPVMRIAAGGDVTEGAGATFTITASPAPATDLTIAYTVTQSGDYLAAPGAGNRTVTLVAGSTSTTVSVATADDAADEADGSVSVTLAGGTGYTVATGEGSAAVTVRDDDKPVVSIAAGSGVTEGTDAAFTITASPPPTTPLAVALTIGQGGDVALAGETGSRTVTIPVSGSLGIDIATVNDAVDEPDGSITASVAAGDGYTVGSPSTQTVAVADDDAAPSTPILSLSAGSAITEGEGASFTITADPAPTTDLTVTYTVAQSGEYLDAPGAGSRTATLAAGTTSVGIEVATVDDAADEADGSVSVTLGTGTGYTVATGKGSTAVAVRDNDEPVVSITAGPGVTEGTDASFTITADPLPAAPLDVTLTITQSGDVAASGQTGARTVTIPAAGTATFSVATDDDAADEPDGTITATIDTGTGYSTGSPAAATVTVTDNDATTPSTGPTISIADATMNGNQHNGWFTVTLSEKVAWPVHVYYATRDSNPVSAVAGQDYLAWKRSWRLRARFRPGQTETKIHVPLYNDSHDEDPETFEMVLFDAGVNGPPGVTVSIADGVAVGTITNSDPMPAAFLSRFGRTVAQQALDGIETRLAAERSPGTSVTIAGQALALGTAGHAGASPLDDLLARQAPTDTDPFGHHPPEPLSMTASEALLASSFTTTGETASGSLAIWGRAARDSFDGQEGTFTLDGTATTAMLGADYGRDRWLLGMALLQSSGKGSYADTDVTPRPPGQVCPPAESGETPCGEAIRAGDGKVEASLTAIVPYASIQTSERLRLWAALGHGTGEVTLTPKVGPALTADTSWQMAAAGMRAELTAIGSGTLHLTSDALWSRTRSDKTHALAASDATVTRLRAGLEASWQIGLASGAMLTPGLEAGVRHDGGDAEQGAGIELGGSLAFRDPASGFSMDLSARKLIAHDDDDFEENGLAASFTFDPEPASARGLSVSLRQDAGKAEGGVDTLFMPQALERQDTGATATTAEAAYGLAALAGRFTIAPHARLRMDDASRETTIGLRLTPERGAPDLSLGLEVTRREHGAAAPVHGVGVGVTLRW